MERTVVLVEDKAARDKLVSEGWKLSAMSEDGKSCLYVRKGLEPSAFPSGYERKS